MKTEIVNLIVALASIAGVLLALFLAREDIRTEKARGYIPDRFYIYMKHVSISVLVSVFMALWACYVVDTVSRFF